MSGFVQAKNALTALKQKFPDGIADVSILSEEQKAWLVLQVLALADSVPHIQTIVELKKIRNRLAHATEDIPDKELQKIMSFVFDNMAKINKVIKLNEAINEEK